MKKIDIYGEPVMSYEGLVSVDTGEVKSEQQGYFEAVQVQAGKITIACFWPTVVDFPIGVTNFPLMAVDTRGWRLTVEGETFWPQRTIKSTQGISMTYAVAVPIKLRATKLPQDRKMNYLSTRFAVTNLLLGHSTTKIPGPTKFTVGEWVVTIKPVEAYLERSESLRAVSGIEHTVSVEVRKTHGERQSLDDAASFMDDMVSALRLWSGNKLDWLYGEGLNDFGNEAIERLHKHSVVGQFSNNLSEIGWEINLENLVKSYFSGDQPLGHENTVGFIDYFVDACATGPYIQTRGLTSATLLDAGTLNLVALWGHDEVLPESEFVRAILPLLKEAIELTELDDQTKDPLKNNLQGIFRTSFRRRLNLISTRLNLGLDSSFRDQVMTTRDALVHRGQFPEGDRQAWLTDYRRLLWTDAAILCRIAGYKAELPPKP